LAYVAIPVIQYDFLLFLLIGVHLFRLIKLSLSVHYTGRCWKGTRITSDTDWDGRIQSFHSTGKALNEFQDHIDVIW